MRGPSPATSWRLLTHLNGAKACILGLYKDIGNEDGDYYSMLGYALAGPPPTQNPPP